MTKVKVSACIITYNHEDFIRECLEGAISQIVNFNYEIIIGDDCSSDNTKQICSEYSIKFPNLIKYTKRNNNLGMIGNWTATIQECTGKYIALCEGDDYWTDPYKLQKQVDFLEANLDYVLCFHKVDILKIDETIVEDFITKVPENYETIETLARSGNYIHTPSVVFRNIIQVFPPEFEQSPIGDFFLYMILAQHGKLKYLQDSMAVYRHGVGIWSAESDYYRNLQTAYMQALLFKYFSSNQIIMYVLKERIMAFLKTCEGNIKAENLSLLNTCNEVNESIYQFLLNKRTIQSSEIVKQNTSKQLIVEVLMRIRRKLWVK